MAIVTRNITFNRNYLATGTLIEYKEEGGSWIAPSIPSNPTTLETYPLDFEEDTTYYVRVSSVGGQCTKSSTIITVYISSGDCCPEDYTISPDGTYCYQINTIPAIPPTGGTPDTSVPKTFEYYSRYGSTIYDIGFNVNGTGTNTRITPLADGLWGNPGLSASVGPLNRTGMWGTTTTANQLVGFSYCFSLTESKTYYVAAAADNEVIIKLDGNTILSMDEDALTTYLYTEYGIIDVEGHKASFTFWNIYPVVIPAGPHILELIGRNGPGGFPNPASFGAEIYDNTALEIASATVIGDLNIIFSTEDFRSGQDLQLGTDGTGYTCPEDYSLDSCDIPYTCRELITTDTIAC